MKRFYLLLLLCCAVMLRAQETYLWPIEGKEAGEGILYQPEDYIEREHNYDDLFITAAAGTNILSPCDGTVSNFSLSYLSSLTTTRSFGNTAPPFKDAVERCRENVEKNGGDLKYLSYKISIKSNDGRVVRISGLCSDRPFASGQKVKKGEVLGKIHYCYKSIPQHCISLSVDKGGKASDPMSPFGLKSTFVPPVTRQPKQRLTRAEATADYRQLAGSIKEIYPSLDDFMNETEYDAFVESEIAKLPESIALADFARMMMHFNHKIHDSHLWFSYGVNTAINKGKKLPPLYFGRVDGTVKVLTATEKYRNYMGRELKSINGKPVATLCAELEKYTNLIYDANVQSVTEQELAYSMPYHYYRMDADAQKTGLTTFTFADGEVLTVPLEDKSIASRYDKESQRNFAISKHGERVKENWFPFRVDKKTAYLRLKTFNLMDTELDSLLSFVQRLSAIGIENLIIDLRNNPGGYPHVLYKLVEAVMDEPILHEGGYCKVNAQSFKSPTLNLVSGQRMFENYKQIPGRKGYYQYNEPATKQDSVRQNIYRGRIYVLINAGSASASTTFAGIMKRNNRGYVVGRETRTAYHRMNAMKFVDIQLANSQFKCHIPMVRIVQDEHVSDAFPYGRGVIPHLTVPLSYEELTTDGQLIYNKTLDLIANGIYLEDEAEETLKI